MAGDEGFLLHLITLITGAISRHQLGKLLYDHTERKKELKGIRQTAETLGKAKSLEESLQEVCSFLPDAWQYPESTVARIVFGKSVYTSKGFTETQWSQKQSFETPDGNQWQHRDLLPERIP